MKDPTQQDRDTIIAMLQLDVFACNIDESVGHAELLEADHRATQLTELPGHTFEDIFK